MPVVLHRLANGELHKTYRELTRRRNRALADRFAAEVRTASARIEANPAIGAPIFGPFRWIRVGRFRYLIFYRPTSATVIDVFAIAHSNRRPGYWLRRVNRP